MMRRLSVVLLALALFLTPPALAVELPDLNEYTDAELAALSEALDAELARRASDSRTGEAEAGREVLKQGSRGKAVKELQQRLIELNYLSGRADGEFGAMTKDAVERFQREAGLDASGIADEATQAALFAEDAPEVRERLALDFVAVSRDPDVYEGKEFSFSGNILQVLEEEEAGYTEVELRVATSGNYDDVVYVTYRRRAGESRILEEDRVTIEATYRGLYTYETVIGGTVTLPEFEASSITLE